MFAAKGIIQSPIMSCSTGDHSVCQASANTNPENSACKWCSLYRPGRECWECTARATYDLYDCLYFTVTQLSVTSSNNVNHDLRFVLILPSPCSSSILFKFHLTAIINTKFFLSRMTNWCLQRVNSVVSQLLYVQHNQLSAQRWVNIYKAQFGMLT